MGKSCTPLHVESDKSTIKLIFCCASFPLESESPWKKMLYSLLYLLFFRLLSRPYFVMIIVID